MDPTRWPDKFFPIHLKGGEIWEYQENTGMRP